MIVHFICRGNVFRSRIAESYLNSLDIKNIKVMSSGTVAQVHSVSNKQNIKLVEAVIAEHKLSKYYKKHWDQLTQSRVDDGELTVFLNDIVVSEFKDYFKLPNNYIVWDIPDYDEVHNIPGTKNDMTAYINFIFPIIENKVDELAASLENIK